MKQDVHCWHCGTPSARPVLARTPDGEVPTCCAGCAAAVETIHSLGLGDYYCFRGEQLASVPAADEELSLALFDLPELVAPFVEISGAQRTLTLSLDGVHCAACVWLIERELQAMPGVLSVSLNLTILRLKVAGTDFSAGDIARRTDRDLPHSGVHAVYAGPVLAKNLRAALAGRETSGTYRGRGMDFYLLNTGRGEAIVSYGTIAMQARWLRRLKDWLDRRWIRRFTRPGAP